MTQRGEAATKPKIRNSKFEARNPKQISNSKSECSKRTETRAISFGILNIIYLKLFRISCFEFRISDENMRKNQNVQT